MYENQTTPSETRKRKHTPQDIAALEKKAKDFAQIGGATATERIHAQAWVAFGLSLDFHRIGTLGADFPRWLSKHSGVCLDTCWRRYKLGRRLAAGEKRKAAEAHLVAEQRRLETTPRPELEGDKD